MDRFSDPLCLSGPDQGVVGRNQPDGWFLDRVGPRVDGDTSAVWNWAAAVAKPGVAVPDEQCRVPAVGVAPR